jgi:4-phytase / acid phosphatase
MNLLRVMAYSLLPAAFAVGAVRIAAAQSAAPQNQKLQFVVIVSRHGVRSPTGKPDRLNHYSAKPWPAWSVPPGYLTDHGAKLMTLFGAYDRAYYAEKGLFDTSGCADADSVYIYDDSDQRTRETGKALAAGIFPGCAIEQHGLPEGTHDPIFHSQGPVSEAEKQTALAAVSGRIGGNPTGLIDAYRPQLKAMEQVLLDCASPSPCPAQSTSARSLFDIPVSLSAGEDDHLVELHGPLETASTVAEDLLLEYTEGMDPDKVGWGSVDVNKLRELLQLHTAAEGIVNRTPFVARAQATALLNIVLSSMRQAGEQKPIAGAMGSQRHRMLLIVGHDTNLANIAGVLGLNWLIDGRRDDTPPGSALVFELWSGGTGSMPRVRTYFTSQTLEQMRNATPLTLAAGPERVPIFVPGCSTADGSCSWSGFAETVQSDLNKNR